MSAFSHCFLGILRNVNECHLSCVRDVDFGLIVIHGEEKHYIVGPFQILSKSAGSCCVEDRLGITYTMEISNLYHFVSF